MKHLLPITLLLFSFAHASEFSQLICEIGGVYELKEGELIQRSERKAIGEQIYIDADSGEVTGHFGTDGWDITKLKRPEGLLTIEIATGYLGDGANRLAVAPIEGTEKFGFMYTKNWLYISGECKPIYRHNQ